MNSEHVGDDHRPASRQEHRPSERREHVMAVIRDNALPLSLSDLARALVDQEASHLTNEDDVDPRHVRVQLHHVDLPKLQDQAEFEYDPSRRLVL